MNNYTDATPDATDWFRYARQVQKQQLYQLTQLGVLAGKISHLTHMLQCERGASNIWLCSKGSFTRWNVVPAAPLPMRTSPRFYRYSPRSGHLPVAHYATVLPPLLGVWNNFHSYANK